MFLSPSPTQTTRKPTESPTQTSHKRSANFSSRETSILVELIDQYKAIIEAKESDTSSIRMKQDAWAALCSDFNASSGEIPRDVPSLRNKYHNMKKKAKRASTQDQMIIPDAEIKEEFVNGHPSHLDCDLLLKEGASGSYLSADTFEIVHEEDTMEDGPVSTSGHDDLDAKHSESLVRTDPRDKIVDWAEQKVRSAEVQRDILQEEHNLRMERERELHELEMRQKREAHEWARQAHEWAKERHQLEMRLLENQLNSNNKE